MDELVSMVKEMGYPSAYDHFAEGEAVAPPFICYLASRSDNFSADGIVWHKAAVIGLELYTDKKNLAAEAKVESVLETHGFFWNRSETWIESEKLYEVLYTFEMEV